MENSKKDKIEKILVIFLLFALALVFLFQSPLCPFTSGKSLTDSSVFRTIGWQMTKGLMPYRDTFDHKGPLIYFINYLGTTVSFKYGVWYLELLFLFITFYFIYKISKQLIDTRNSLFVVLLSILYLFKYYDGGNLVEEYALPFISISIYIFLDYFKNDKTNSIRLIICGFCFGCVLILRPNMVCVWIVFCLGVLFKEISKKRYEKLLDYKLRFIIGIVIVILPTLIWLYFNNAINDFYYCYLEFNFLYSTNAERVSIRSIAKCIKYFGMSFPIVFSAIILVLNIIYKKNKYINVLFLSAIILSLLMISMSGQKYNHYGMILIPLVSYPLSLIFTYINSDRNSKYLIALYLVTIIIFSLKCRTNYENTINYTVDYNFEDEVIEAIKNNTNNSDKIFVYGNMNRLYFESDRLPLSKFSYQIPIENIDNNIKNEYISDLYRNNPRCIVITENMNEDLKMFIANNSYEILKTVENIGIYLKK